MLGLVFSQAEKETRSYSLCHVRKQEDSGLQTRKKFLTTHGICWHPEAFRMNHLHVPGQWSFYFL